jgi:hypothetical protein
VRAKTGTARDAAPSRGRARVSCGRAEVGDDGLGPPVSDRGSSGRGCAALGRKLSWAKKRRRRSGASGALGQELRGLLRTSAIWDQTKNRPEMDRMKEMKRERVFYF